MCCRSGDHELIGSANITLKEITPERYIVFFTYVYVEHGLSVHVTDESEPLVDILEMSCFTEGGQCSISTLSIHR